MIVAKIRKKLWGLAPIVTLFTLRLMFTEYAIINTI